MKTRFPSILGVFAAILMVASFVVPMNIAAPAAVTADPGIMKWDTVSTPGSVEGKGDIVNLHPQDPSPSPGTWGVPTGAVVGSGLYGYSDNGFGNEIIDMAIANDGQTIYTVDRTIINVPWASVQTSAALAALLGTGSVMTSINVLSVSTNSGITTSNAKFNALFGTTGFGLSNIYGVAVAPDDPKFVVVISGNNDAISDLSLQGLGPCRLWVSSDGGSNWEMAFDGTAILAGAQHIRDVDVSIDYGGKRDIGFVTDNGQFWVRQSSGFSGWVRQHTLIPPTPAVTAYYTLKFSPTYSGDSAVALVYGIGTVDAAPNGTYYNVALRDLSSGANDVVKDWVDKDRG